MTDINVGQLSEAINGKMDRDANNIESPKLPIFLVDVQYPTAENNYTWYRLYSDGWIEQGGRLPTQGTTTTVTLPHAMADTNYSVLTQEAEDGSTDTDGVDFCCLVCIRTTTTIKFSTVSGSRRSFYEVKGMAA